MAVIMDMRWEGVTQDQYDQTMQRLGLDENPPDGGRFHLAGPADGAWRAVDVWESPDQFQRFVEERLTPVTQEVGMQGEPQVMFYPLHNVWARRGEEVIQQGA